MKWWSNDMKWHKYPDEKPELHTLCLCKSLLCKDLALNHYSVYEYSPFPSPDSIRCLVDEDGYAREFTSVEWIGINEIEQIMEK